MHLPQMEPVMQQMNVLNEMGLPQDHVRVAMVYVVHVSTYLRKRLRLQCYT